MNAYFRQVFEQWVPSAASELLSFWTSIASDFTKLGLQPSPAEPRDVIQTIQEAVANEVTARWKPVEEQLTETMRSFFAQELERLSDDQKMSLEAYSSAAVKKLHEIMNSLAAEAKNALDADEENSTVKLLRFPRSKYKLMEVFRHESHEQLIQEPWKVAFLSLTSTSTVAACERFIKMWSKVTLLRKNLMQRLLDTTRSSQCTCNDMTNLSRSCRRYTKSTAAPT